MIALVPALALVALAHVGSAADSLRAAGLEARFGRAAHPVPAATTLRGLAPRNAPDATAPAAKASPPIAQSADGSSGAWMSFDPPALEGAAAVYDSAADRMVTYGGYDGRRLLGGLAFDAGTSTWTALAPAGPAPSPRDLPMGAFDSARRAMWVFGGQPSGGQFANGLWRLDLAGAGAWTSLQPFGTWPDGRLYGALVHDPARDRLVLFGGVTLSFLGGEVPLNDVWVLSPAADTLRWARIDVAGPAPSPRLNAAVAWDPHADALLVAGGASPDSAFTDAWELAFSPVPHWVRLDPLGAPPPLPMSAPAAFDLQGDRLIGIGGANPYGGVASRVAWELELVPAPRWVVDSLVTGGPPAVLVPAAAFDARRRRLLVHGGIDGGTFDAYPLHTTWALDAGGPLAWERLAPVREEPSARFGQATAYDPASERMWIFGGVVDGADSLAYPNELWQASLGDSVTWRTLATTGPAPAGRHEPVGVYDPQGRRLYFFGGWRAPEVYLDDTWSVSADSPYVWSRLPGPLEGATAPPGRRGHCAAYDPARHSMIVFGGFDADSVMADTWELSFDDGAWRRIVPAGDGPGALYFASAVYDPGSDRVVIFGGESGSQSLDSTWALDFAGGPHWEALTPGVYGYGPSSRHAAVYDPIRRRMLVWGGFDIDYDVIFEFDHIAALGLDPPPQWSPVAESGNSPGSLSASSTVFDARRDRWITFGGFVDFGTAQGSTEAFEFTTATAPSDAWWTDTRVDGRTVTVRWSTVAAPGSPVTVERRVDAAGEGGALTSGVGPGDWRAWSAVVVAADGSVTAADPGTHPGGVYDYRLRFAGAAGAVAETRVSIPGIARLSILRAFPNPTRESMFVGLVSDGVHAIDETVCDVRGRVVLRRTMVAPAAGPAQLTLTLPAGTRAGVYFLHLRQGSVEVTRKVVYLP